MVFKKLLAAALPILVAVVPTSYAADDSSQLNSMFRINYAGYLPEANKLALYLSSNTGTVRWSVRGINCSGTEDTYVANDQSSGDSFYRIDFSKCTTLGNNLRLEVNGQQSPPFDISSDPYGNIKYEFFDYFKDHEAHATFTNAKNNWQNGLNLSFSYVKDAGDNGAYPVNTAEAAWSLINLLETYPAINTYYSSNYGGARSVYDQLKIITEQFNHVLSHTRKLAIPKFHTHVNESWANCSPHTSGTCISEPETKATYATARTLAAMARLHKKYGDQNTANDAYQRAQMALSNAEGEPVTCNQADSFGGEGGMYPDNDNTSIYRDPKMLNDNCVSHKDNTEDDHYAALVESYLAALALGHTSDAQELKNRVTSHQRFNDITSFWWGAVSTEGNLSLITNEQLHDINLSQTKTRIIRKADEIHANQAKGYPGVTWDARSNQWDVGDQNNADNNVRWGSHRMALNDARILMAASEIKRKQSDANNAALYARAAIQVLDHIAGINAINITMFTAGGYGQFEHAIERTHDGANGDDSWAGKMILGPNNWTNANDGDMPPFNSKPGLKMFPLTGTGWAAREISIDANASLVPVAYFTTEIAPAIMAQAPQNGPAPTPEPKPMQFTIEVNQTANGFITPGTIRVNANTQSTFTLHPNMGYQIDAVFKNGVNLGAVNSVTFNQLDSNQTLSARFAASEQPKSIPSEQPAAGTVNILALLLIFIIALQKNCLHLRRS